MYMEDFMKYLFTYVVTFLIVYLIYFLFVVNRKKALKKLENSMEVRYLINRYKIDISKFDPKKIANIVALSNSFIMSTVFVIILFIKSFMLRMLLGFISLFPIILGTYHLVALYLKKKEGK